MYRELISVEWKIIEKDADRDDGILIIIVREIKSNKILIYSGVDADPLAHVLVIRCHVTWPVIFHRPKVMLSNYCVKAKIAEK